MSYIYSFDFCVILPFIYIYTYISPFSGIWTGWMSAICDAHKKKVGVELLYNLVHRKFNQLEIRCSRENQHPAEEAFRPLIEQLKFRSVEVQISWREDAGMRNMSQRGWAPRPPVEQPRRMGKKHCYGHKSRGQYVAVLFSLQLALTVKPLVKLLNPFK